MSPRTPAVASFVAAALVALGCGRTEFDRPGEPATDAARAGDDARESSEPAPSCSGLLSLSANSGGWCAAEVSLSGVTPLEPFCPTAVRADVNIGDCAKTLSVAVADGDAVTWHKLIQFGSIPFDSARRSFTGTYQIIVFLMSRSSGSTKTTTTKLNATVDVLAADDPYIVDGGVADTSNPPVGAVDLRFTVQAPTGTFGGTVAVRYCNWGLCI